MSEKLKVNEAVTLENRVAEMENKLKDISKELRDVKSRVERLDCPDIVTSYSNESAEREDREYSEMMEKLKKMKDTKLIMDSIVEDKYPIAWGKFIRWGPAVVYPAPNFPLIEGVTETTFQSLINFFKEHGIQDSRNNVGHLSFVPPEKRTSIIHEFFETLEKELRK